MIYIGIGLEDISWLDIIKIGNLQHFAQTPQVVFEPRAPTKLLRNGSPHCHSNVRLLCVPKPDPQ